jgi:anhydro-N-acetylmuramic acid kinase
MQIGKNIPKGNCLLTGGGVFNTSLINALKKHTQSTLEIPKNNLIEYKEALVFAYLGMLRLTNRKNTLSSVTGARRDSIGGCLYG